MRNKNRTLTLAAVGALTAVQVVLSRFLSISAWNMKIGFGFVPIAAAGMLLGPLPAALVGGLSDFLGAVLFPIGPYFPGFTLTAALTGAVYGLLLHKRQGVLRVLSAVGIVQFILSLGLNTLWISVLSGTPWWAQIPVRLTQAAVLTPVQVVVILLLERPVASLEKELAR